MFELLTGCRLHFGLLELAAGQPHRYGGLGLMVESPRLRLRWHSARPQSTQDSAASMATAATTATSVEVRRRVELAHSHAEAIIRASMPQPESSPTTSTCIEVLECPPMHSGLGVGTQLAMSVARLTELGLVQSSGRSIATHQVLKRVGDADVVEAVRHLAQLSGRGKRSAIGMHGFVAGGLVRDLGYTANAIEPAGTNNSNAVNTNAVRPIQTTSCSMPDAWRVVLWTSRTSGDMHGEAEDRLIDRAATRLNPHRHEMLELSERCLTAAQHDNFIDFATSLDRYMVLAARMFSEVQAGQYRDLRTAERVTRMRDVGLAGVGQSSWGPTVFGFATSGNLARVAVEQLGPYVDRERESLILTQPLNHGSRWSMVTTAEGVQHAG